MTISGHLCSGRASQHKQCTFCNIYSEVQSLSHQPSAHCCNLPMWSTVCSWHAANGKYTALGMHAWSALTGLMTAAAFTSHQLLSVASGHVSKGASQVTVEMRYKGRAVHHRLIDCKFSALCALAEDLWPVLTAIDYSFECSNTAIPFDTEV